MDTGPGVLPIKRTTGLPRLSSNKTRIIDIDLRAYLDNVKHHILLTKVARRVQDADIMRFGREDRKITGKVLHQLQSGSLG